MAEPTAVDDVVVLRRPGCGFCVRLERALDGAGLDYVSRDIWQDPDAAATVRRVAGGSETVPTVLIGDVGMVNPPPNEVLRLVHEKAPERLPEDFEPPEPGPVARLATRLLGDG